MTRAAWVAGIGTASIAVALALPTSFFLRTYGASALLIIPMSFLPAAIGIAIALASPGRRAARVAMVIGLLSLSVMAIQSIYVGLRAGPAVMDFPRMWFGFTLRMGLLVAGIAWAIAPERRTTVGLLWLFASAHILLQIPSAVRGIFDLSIVTAGQAIGEILALAALFTLRPGPRTMPEPQPLRDPSA